MEMKDLRKKIQDFIREQTTNIDSLFTDKISEFVLLEEQPLAVKIGNPVGNYKTVFIGNFTFTNSHKFWNSYGKVLAHLGTKFVNFDMLNNAEQLYSTMKINKRFFKEMCRLIHKHIVRQQAYFLPKEGDTRKRKDLAWRNCSARWIVNNITEEQIIQICGLIYMYNFEAVKKNFTTLLHLMRGAPQSETYIYSWLENAAGLTGNFQQLHLQKPLWFQRESQSQNDDNSPNNPEKQEVALEAETTN